MICLRCEQAADIASGRRYGLEHEVTALHQSCQYPNSCTCQHAVGEGWIRK